MVQGKMLPMSAPAWYNGHISPWSSFFMSLYSKGHNILRYQENKYH